MAGHRCRAKFKLRTFVNLQAEFTHPRANRALGPTERASGPNWPISPAGMLKRTVPACVWKLSANLSVAK
jgi:hypothetical protein